MRDIVIIGGGPAGLTLGCYLADAGVAPLVLEKLNHPRPHVGESLMPSTVRIIREIGFHEIVESAGQHPDVESGFALFCEVVTDALS